MIGGGGAVDGELRLSVTDGLSSTRLAINVVDASTPAYLSKIRHDIQHELATIMLLAEVVQSSDDVGPASRVRLEQLGRETHWLDELLQIYDNATRCGQRDDAAPPASPVRVDLIAGEVLAAMRMTTMAQVQLRATPAWTVANPLALWRALRNVVQNAFRAAGQNGRVEVRVELEADRIVAQIDDDGPGFGLGPTGIASLGLGIVQDFAVDHGGVVEIAGSELGGSCIRLVLPALVGGSVR
jgi:signal transduction histidine kinase